MTDFKITDKHPKICMITLGCAKNTVDSEVMLGLFIQHGCQITIEPEYADVIVINTCGFIEDAKKEAVDIILEAVELKKLKGNLKIYVTGCLAQRYYHDIWREIPELDGILGVENFHRIIDYIIDPKKDMAEWGPKGHGSFLYDHNTPRVISTPSYMAYMKIAEGCSHTCRFCAIPLIRGKFRSRELDSLLLEAESHAQNGVKELILIAQDTSYWGKDLDSNKHLADLLKQLNEVNGLEWIRLLYLHPDEIDNRLLNAMSSLDKVVNYVDIPIQHVNRRILQQMNRGYKTDFKKLINEIREFFNGEVAIRTTFLTGFPGETDYEFDEILEFLEEMKLDRVTAFPYSDEDGTEAYRLENKLDTEIARLRYERLMDTQRDISFFLNEQFIGKTLKVLVEGTENEGGRTYLTGRSYRDAPEVDGNVLFKGDAVQGDFVNVEITDVRDYDLEGFAI